MTEQEKTDFSDGLLPLLFNDGLTRNNNKNIFNKGSTKFRC